MLGGDEEKDPDAAKKEEERQEALRQAEEERKAKYAKMEAEREVMRQGIRDKVGTRHIWGRGHALSGQPGLPPTSVQLWGIPGGCGSCWGVSTLFSCRGAVLGSWHAGRYREGWVHPSGVWPVRVCPQGSGHGVRHPGLVPLQFARWVGGNLRDMVNMSSGYCCWMQLPGIFDPSPCGAGF